MPLAPLPPGWPPYAAGSAEAALAGCHPGGRRRGVTADAAGATVAEQPASAAGAAVTSLTLRLVFPYGTVYERTAGAAGAADGEQPTFTAGAALTAMGGPGAWVSSHGATARAAGCRPGETENARTAVATRPALGDTDQGDSTAAVTAGLARAGEPDTTALTAGAAGGGASIGSGRAAAAGLTAGADGRGAAVPAGPTERVRVAGENPEFVPVIGVIGAGGLAAAVAAGAAIAQHESTTTTVAAGAAEPVARPNPLGLSHRHRRRRPAEQAGASTRAAGTAGSAVDGHGLWASA